MGYGVMSYQMPMYKRKIISTQLKKISHHQSVSHVRTNIYNGDRGLTQSGSTHGETIRRAGVICLPLKGGV